MKLKFKTQAYQTAAARASLDIDLAADAVVYRGSRISNRSSA